MDKIATYRRHIRQILFSASGRRIYLADEMAVLYPGEEAFTPDILGVLDVEQPEDDERMAWVVADEDRGLDLTLWQRRAATAASAADILLP